MSTPSPSPRKSLRTSQTESSLKRKSDASRQTKVTDENEDVKVDKTKVAKSDSKTSVRMQADTSHIRVVVPASKGKAKKETPSNLPKKALPRRTSKVVVLDSDDDDADVHLSEASDAVSSEGQSYLRALLLQALLLTMGIICIEEEVIPIRKKSTAKASNTLGNFIGKDVSVLPKTKASKIGGPSKKEKEVIDETTLAPLTEIPDMFQDMVQNRPEFKKTVELLAGRPLRVATMCSGTESPLLALDLISKSVKDLWGLDFRVQHVFSCEIEPFKQAYIERNFQPPILFRDVCELGQEKATTAYGAQVTVPNDVDMLIAGTSCVDYSGLNNRKKSIDAGGESGRTFHGMLKWVENSRPSVIILENVCNAPWPKVKEKFHSIGYDAEFSRFDTKHYYIPHTRTRVYLIATPQKLRSSSGSHIPQKWLTLVSQMARPASAPLEAFMYHQDDPLVHRARQELAFVKANKDGQGRQATDWTRCESRHARQRAEEQLGDKRPLTAWQDGPVCKVIDGGWNDWANAQTERVVDLMDINTLREVKNGFDVQYKTTIWNLSQNVDRMNGSGKFGITPCLTPNMIAYVTNRGGPLIGREALSLQGIPISGLLLTKESEDQLADLAGNAMSTTVVGSAMVAALILTMPKVKKQLEGEDVVMEDARIESLPHATPHDLLKGDEDLVSSPLNLSKTLPVSPGFFERATCSARLCICEGRSGIAAAKIQCCQACGYTSCQSCGGRPRHNYETRNEERLNPATFERELKDILPMRLSLQGLDKSFLSQLSVQAKEAGIKVDAAEWTIIREAILEAVEGVEFHFRSLKRQQIWVVNFDAPKATLELRLDPCHPEWRLSVKADKSAPIKSPHRLLLNTPVARLRIDQKTDDLISGSWNVRLPVNQSFDFKFEGTGSLVPGWRKEMGLTDENARSEEWWSEWTVTTPQSAEKYLDRALDGVWKLHSDCGTAQNMLHRKVETEADQGLPPLYLMLDPTRSGEPENDYAVFTIQHSRLDYGVVRPTIARLDAKWRPSSKKTVTVTCHVSDKWFSAPTLSLSTELHTEAKASADTKDGVFSIPKDGVSVKLDDVACQKANVVVACKVPLPTKQIDPVWGTGDWRNIDIPHQGESVFQSLAWITERVPPPESLCKWSTLSAGEQCSPNCQRCAPSEPVVKWVVKQQKTKSTLVPHEDMVEAGRYEQALKNRPAPFITQLRLVDGCGEFRIGINFATLVHRAISRFPTTANSGDIIPSWRVTFGHGSNAGSLLRPKFNFSLSSNKKDEAAPQPPHFRTLLRPEQLRSLSWMLKQEKVGDDVTHTFIEEEISEASLEPLGWRAEGKAERPVLIRGGVLADEVGYGKTAITIGLIDATLKDPLPPVPKPHLKGFVQLKATLIIVPAHLSGQWPKEFTKFTGSNKIKVHRIINMTDLNSTKICDLQEADVVVVSETIFGSQIYWSNLAMLAGTRDIVSDEKGGRFFKACLHDTLKKLRKHVEILKSKAGGSSALHQAMQDAQNDLANMKNTKQVQSTRLKGAAYAKKHASETAESGDEEEEEEEEEEEDSDDSDDRPAKKAKVGTAKSQAIRSKVQTGDAWKLKTAAKDDWTQMHCPPLHMFYWNRRTIDEYTYLSGREQLAVGTIHSWSTWILSGTPPVANFTEIKSIARLLHVHLGIDDDGEGTKEIAKAFTKQQTAAEQFHSFREIRSTAWHHRRDEVAQAFLDRFVRQNVAEIDEIPYEERIEPITLPSAERAIYLELDHHLQSFDMNLKKVSRTKKTNSGIADREKRLAAALGESKSAEEALLKRCSHFTSDLAATSQAHDAENAGAACTVILDERTRQLDECLEELRIKLKQAALLYVHTKTAGLYEKDEKPPPFEEYIKMSFESIGDDEANQRLQKILVEEGCIVKGGKVVAPKISLHDEDVEEVLTHVDPKLAIEKAKERKKSDAKKGIKTKAVEEKERKLSKDEILQARKWAARELIHVLRKLNKELVNRFRSKRYFTIVRDVQRDHVSTTIKNDEGIEEPMAILSTCGHHGPLSLVTKSAYEQECCKKVSLGCSAPARDTSVIRADSLGHDEESGKFGIKLERLCHLISKLRSTDRVLVFVQFSDLLDKVYEALEHRDIGVARVKGTARQQMQVMTEFQEEADPDIRVLLLHATDSSASGANLTNANYAFFVSPLFLPTQDKFKACETQAIGRLRRYGQTKKVHVIRLLTTDTIDTQIYGHRHQKTQDELRLEIEAARKKQIPFVIPS
ncbi:uncharacterized protein MELLADRAFT_79036 [Melampsora larici-populina 98AG31]|uniref:Helicase C-terminal domain-containing protein n=1 Tax=Melampsora larici-populina (strain 98AG31 / pathotype 3-4-7) TaxID=747676 RepID=F4S1W1_MELLP|nr:uncharacterized protein MELLADRAFT_79036 [Melampsora larici-populina 98AG31]EGG01261.1 hypothetical protein MELLADRAFT_79036 [Melampsora larici-populina 98AG31]